MTEVELTIRLLELRLKQAIAQRDVLAWELEIQKLSAQLFELEKREIK